MLVKENNDGQVTLENLESCLKEANKQLLNQPKHPSFKDTNESDIGAKYKTEAKKEILSILQQIFPDQDIDVLANKSLEVAISAVLKSPTDYL